MWGDGGSRDVHFSQSPGDSSTPRAAVLDCPEALDGGLSFIIQAIFLPISKFNNISLWCQP